MSAITWQNINSPSSRDVGRELSGAQIGISDGFDRLSKVFADREAVNQGVADRARNAGAEDYLNMLQGYKTPEELNAARLSGVLDQRIAALDPRNQAAVRGAADARVTSLQGQVTANNAFAVNQINAPVALANAQATADNAPLQRNLDRLALEQKTQLEPITSATALATATNASNAAKLTGTLQSTTDATALLTAKNAEAQAKVAAADLAANDALTLRAQSRRQESLDLPYKQGKAIKDSKLDFPLTAQGTPDISTMEKTTGLIENFNKKMLAMGMAPTTDTLDTQNFIAEQAKTGPEARAAIQRALAARGGELNTSSINMLSGADRDKLGGELDAIDRHTELAKQNNSLFIVGGRNAADSIDEVRKQVQAAVGPGEEEKVRIVMREVQNELTARPNMPLHIPSIVNAAATAQSWGFGHRWDELNLSYADYFKNSLYKSMKTPAYLSQLADYEEFKNDNPVIKKQQAVQSIMQSAGLPYSGYTPPQLLRSNTPTPPPGKK